MIQHLAVWTWALLSTFLSLEAQFAHVHLSGNMVFTVNSVKALRKFFTMMFTMLMMILIVRSHIDIMQPQYHHCRVVCSSEMFVTVREFPRRCFPLCHVCLRNYGSSVTHTHSFSEKTGCLHRSSKWASSQICTNPKRLDRNGREKILIPVAIRHLLVLTLAFCLLFVSVSVSSHGRRHG